jgi:hypothetical protein
MPYELCHQPAKAGAQVLGKFLLVPSGAWGCECKVGRTKGESHIFIDGNGISRKHATITIATRPSPVLNEQTLLKIGSSDLVAYLVAEGEDVQMKDLSRIGYVSVYIKYILVRQYAY